MDKPYTYVIVRKDISPEQQSVQACHATLEAGFKFQPPESTSFLVLLEVANQEELLAAS